MKFRTEIRIAPLSVRIGYENRLLALGSCFAEHISGRLSGARFRITSNPSGILFNPLSLAATLESYAAPQEVVPEELGCRNGLWFHYGFHGAFSDGSQKMALSKMNLARRAGASALREADRVILTFGTAWVYELRSTGEIVANCHKQPAELFRRRRLTVEEIVARYDDLQAGPLAGKQVILTVSPVRHLGDGLPDNFLSKATLRLAIDEICRRHADSAYFPATKSSRTTCATTVFMPTIWYTPATGTAIHLGTLHRSDPHRGGPQKTPASRSLDDRRRPPAATPRKRRIPSILPQTTGNH